VVTLRKHINSLERLDQLIRMKATGAPKELARKLDISERWLYEYIQFLKIEMNAPVKFNRERSSYEYEVAGRLQLRWQQKQ